MTNHLFKKALGILSAAGIVCSISCAHAADLPNPLHDEAMVKDSPTRTIVLSGGCFWGIQAVFQHVNGVTKAVSGYAGGAADTAHYEMVSGGDTGHAESVEVTYNPAVVSAGQLLKVFFAVAHNPTELNRQGPDSGTQYRSAIFYTTAEQEKIATAYIAQLDSAKVFPVSIVTAVGPLKAFYPAESYHQDYARLHPNDPYIAYNDLPKVEDLKKTLPDLYTGE